MTQTQMLWAAFLGGAFSGIVMMVLIGIVLSRTSVEEEDSYEHG